MNMIKGFNPKGNIIGISDRRSSGTNEQTLCRVDLRSFDEQLANDIIRPELAGRCMSILEWLDRLLLDWPLGQISSGLFDEPRDSGKVAFNFIPSEGQKTSCHEVLLSIASGGTTSRKGFSNVMREVRAHLIDCSSKTGAVLLLTNTWEPRRFNESKSDIEAHRRAGVVFVGGIISGDKITAMPLPV